jgi:subtilisin family serine protease
MQSKKGWRALLAIGVLTTALLPMLTASPVAGAAQEKKQSYIVVLKQSVSRASTMADEERSSGDDVQHVYESALKGFAVEMTATRAARVARDPRVAYVELDTPVHGVAQTLPTGINRMDADVSSTQSGNGSGGVNVPVAVIDTGIDSSHADLRVVGGKDCTIGLSTTDDNGHGSHVAGTIGAKDDANGVVGVAPNTPLYAVKVLTAAGTGLNSWVICGIDWVTANAQSLGIKVANMSLGGAGTDDGSCGNTNNDALHKAICGSVAKGVTYVVAAGNDGVNYQSTTPAAYNEVLTVTAVSDYNGLPGGGAAATCQSDADDSAASFSNWTTASSPDAAHTIAAPGSCIYSTTNLGGYATMSGTSMASPHVTGLVALCISSGGCAGLTPAQIIAKLRADAAAQPASFGFTYPAGRYYGSLVSAAGY